MIGRIRLTIAVAAGLVSAAGGPAPAQRAARPTQRNATAKQFRVPIAQTKHNLSASGPGEIKAQTESRICIFCHVSHGAEGRGSNRPEPAGEYTPYSSESMKSPPPGAPSGATRQCLSCHDGTIAPGRTLRSGTIDLAAVSYSASPEAAPALGTDLRTSHPVSFEPTITSELRRPPAGDPVKLDRHGRLQCTSCHDPHLDGNDPVQGDFLAKENRRSALCLTCHALDDWESAPSSHQSSTKEYDARHGAHTGYDTVAANGCSSCHRQHGAETTSYLLKEPNGQVCLDCHDGEVADTDIAADLTKRYVHPVLTSDPELHDAAEGPSNADHVLPERSAATQRHVTCADCHNPHAASDDTAVAPQVTGALQGVWGIEWTGERVERARYEYEICFKCHGDSANKPRRDLDQTLETTRRALPDDNLRRRFDPNAPSFHPVVQQGRNKDVPSLIAPLKETSIIYCTDCHSSDQARDLEERSPSRTERAAKLPRNARGPHGSIYPYILEHNYLTADFTPENPDAYALCYKCHDRDILLSDESSFPLHLMHVRDQSAPCSACHDSHGVSSVQGNDVNNAHLINFDVSIVSRNTRGIRRYTSTGPEAGRCSLACHQHDHDDARYQRRDEQQRRAPRIRNTVTPKPKPALKR